MIALRGGELQHHDTVVGLQVRVICQNLLTARSGRKQIEGVLGPDPQRPSPGTADVPVRVVHARTRAFPGGSAGDGDRTRTGETPTGF